MVSSFTQGRQHGRVSATSWNKTTVSFDQLWRCQFKWNPGAAKADVWSQIPTSIHNSPREEDKLAVFSHSSSLPVSEGSVTARRGRYSGAGRRKTVHQQQAESHVEGFCFLVRLFAAPSPQSRAVWGFDLANKPVSDGGILGVAAAFKWLGDRLDGNLPVHAVGWGVFPLCSSHTLLTQSASLDSGRSARPVRTFPLWRRFQTARNKRLRCSHCWVRNVAIGCWPKKPLEASRWCHRPIWIIYIFPIIYNIWIISNILYIICILFICIIYM